jgi:hypothetical protein
MYRLVARHSNKCRWSLSPGSAWKGYEKKNIQTFRLEKCPVLFRKRFIFGGAKRDRLTLPLFHDDGLAVEEPLGLGLGLAPEFDVPH